MDHFGPLVFVLLELPRERLLIGLPGDGLRLVDHLPPLDRLQRHHLPLVLQHLVLLVKGQLQKGGTLILLRLKYTRYRPERPADTIQGIFVTWVEVDL